MFREEICSVVLREPLKVRVDPLNYTGPVHLYRKDGKPAAHQTRRETSRYFCAMHEKDLEFNLSPYAHCNVALLPVLCFQTDMREHFALLLLPLQQLTTTISLTTTVHTPRQRRNPTG